MAVTAGTHHYVLTAAWPSAPGQVAAISTFIDARKCYIDEFAVFDDEPTGRFFVRCVFHTTAGGAVALAEMRDEFAQIAERFGTDWAIHDTAVRPRVLIMVSKFDHCLNDLLYRWRINELRIDIPMIVSNHRDLEPVAQAHGIAYRYLPVTKSSVSELW